MSQFKVGDKVNVRFNNGWYGRGVILENPGNGSYLVETAHSKDIIDESKLTLQCDVVTIDLPYPTNLHVTTHRPKLTQCECGAIKAKSGHADWCDMSPCKKQAKTVNCNCDAAHYGTVHRGWCITNAPH